MISSESDRPLTARDHCVHPYHVAHQQDDANTETFTFCFWTMRRRFVTLLRAGKAFNRNLLLNILARAHGPSPFAHLFCCKNDCPLFMQSVSLLRFLDFLDAQYGWQASILVSKL
jgi:hypothetical protein